MTISGDKREKKGRSRDGKRMVVILSPGTYFGGLKEYQGVKINSL